ncbi:MAG: hypothetical protein GEU83_15750 [Pseudonocardiaceae bacterium]|nr:hypothetical protein [Pseudonocardiaceae bacterium]
MALIRLRGACEAGNVCLTLIRDTDTGDALLQGPLDSTATAALKAPDGEVVIRIPAEQVANMLYDLGPATRTDTPGREVLA